MWISVCLSVSVSRKSKALSNKCRNKGVCVMGESFGCVKDGHVNNVQMSVY